ncbi:hypothetical protein [Marichromatium bheemlicum]|uniref:Uncharacterized protein n=1 Tax=Marichromatium bheemlicum TaxID=365339 RepID=A0ABX1I3I2_9GAMM|nr:hypothetical protein [Marichromatium bheemlicum]NKN31683.1 hypothetical protein [Marichromatium bheemlicum]
MLLAACLLVAGWLAAWLWPGALTWAWFAVLPALATDAVGARDWPALCVAATLCLLIVVITRVRGGAVMLRGIWIALLATVLVLQGEALALRLVGLSDGPAPWAPWVVSGAVLACVLSLVAMTPERRTILPFAAVGAAALLPSWPLPALLWGGVVLLLVVVERRCLVED